MNDHPDEIAGQSVVAGVFLFNFLGLFCLNNGTRHFVLNRLSKCALFDLLCCMFASLANDGRHSRFNVVLVVLCLGSANPPGLLYYAV